MFSLLFVTDGCWQKRCLDKLGIGEVNFDASEEYFRFVMIDLHFG